MAPHTVIENMPPYAKGKNLGEPVQAMQADSDEQHFHAVLFPNRSLSNKDFAVVMTVIIGLNLIASILYFILGAWPVIFFCGLDALAVWIAFKVSYHQGRLHERILLTDNTLWVFRVLPSGHETRWKLEPFWLQASIDRPVKQESQLILKSHGQRLIVGHFLSPKERGDLADALITALGKYKAPQIRLPN